MGTLNSSLHTASSDQNVSCYSAHLIHTEINNVFAGMRNYRVRQTSDKLGRKKDGGP